jgi:RNA polymerase sigma factor (sigma-70 family)
MEGDRELIAAAVDGDARAWSDLVDRYKRLVYSIPRRYSIPPDACEDIFQDVFTLLLKNLARLRDTDTIIKWLMVTTQRECWRWSRRQPRSAGGRDGPRQQEPLSEAVPEEVMLQWERQHLVRQALEDLGGRCRELLEALYLTASPKDYEQLSRDLGIAVGSIGPTRRRCLDKLATLLEELR